jgi:hypothetical protein
MNRFLFLFLLLTFSIRAKTVDQIIYDLNNDGIMDTTILSIPEDWGDPGDFNEVHFKVANKKYDYEFEDGLMQFNSILQDSAKANHPANLVNSINALILKLPNNNIALMFFEYVYASNPGVVWIFSFNKMKLDTLFRNNFHIRGWRVKEGKLYGFWGWPDYSQVNECPDYLPTLEYTFKGNTFIIDDNKSKELTTAGGYPWFGINIREDIEICKEINGTYRVKKRKTGAQE